MLSLAIIKRASISASIFFSDVNGPGLILTVPAGIVPNVQMDLDSIEATKRMIERGLGISFLPYNSLHRELELGTLAHVKLGGGYQVTLPTAVMFRRASSYSAIVRAFLEQLQEIYPPSLS